MIKISTLFTILFIGNYLIAQNAGSTGVGTLNPTHTLHIILDPQSPNPDPLRIEGLKQSNATDTVFLVTDPTQGIIQYLTKVDLINSLGAVGTDDQNIDSVILNGNILSVFIENGNSASVDLSSLISSSDNQNIDSLTLSSSILTTYIENGNSASINLINLASDNNFYTTIGDSLLDDTSWINELRDSVDSDIDSTILNADYTLSIFENGKEIVVDISSLVDTSEWIDGNQVGLKPEAIYARKALIKGDTIIIDNNGRVGFFTSNPTSDFEIVKKAGTTDYLRLSSSSTNNGDVFKIDDQGLMKISNTGTIASITPIVSINGQGATANSPTFMDFEANGTLVNSFRYHSGVYNSFQIEPPSNRHILLGNRNYGTYFFDRGTSQSTNFGNFNTGLNGNKIPRINVYSNNNNNEAINIYGNGYSRVRITGGDVGMMIEAGIDPAFGGNTSYANFSLTDVNGTVDAVPIQVRYNNYQNGTIGSVRASAIGFNTTPRRATYDFLGSLNQTDETVMAISSRHATNHGVTRVIMGGGASPHPPLNSIGGYVSLEALTCPNCASDYSQFTISTFTDGGTKRSFIFDKNGNFLPSNNSVGSLGSATRRWNTLFATNGTINTSDRRFKKDVSSINYGLNEIMQLKAVSYQWKENDNGTHLGFIAQDLQKVLPEVVNIANDSLQTMGVRYTEIIPVLTKAVQEQQYIIDELRNENSLIKAELEEIKRLLLKQNQDYSLKK